MDTSDKKTDFEKEQLQEALMALHVKNKALQTEIETLRNEQFELLRKYNHNLKNPLGNVFSFSDIMIESLDSFNREKTLKYLNVLKEASGFGLDLINAFSVYNSLIRPDFSLNLKPANYTRFLRNTLQEYQAAFPASRRRIRFRDSESDLILNFDSVYLKKVLFQLLSNALRFSNTEDPVEIFCEADREGVTTLVRDRGIGISETQLQKIPFPFYVVNTYDLHQKKCIGLGLSIASRIMHLHKGTLEIDAMPGIETKVSIGLQK